MGRDAFEQQSQREPDWSFVGLEIMDEGPEPLPSDPILLDSEVIGYLTSVSMGYRTGKLLALGYVKRGTLTKKRVCSVQAFGEIRAAVCHDHHVYDPENLRLKS